MKNRIILFALLITNLNSNCQIEPISLEFDSIRALTELNTQGTSEGYPWISNDGLRIYFARMLSNDKIMYSERKSTDDYFSEPTELSVNFNGIGSFSPWLSEDELHIYFITREMNAPQYSKLYHVTRENMNEEFNAPPIG